MTLLLREKAYFESPTLRNNAVYEMFIFLSVTFDVTSITYLIRSTPWQCLSFAVMRG